MKAHPSCKRATKIIPVSEEVVAKGEALGKRGLSWPEIYLILFPEYSDGDIPSSCKITMKLNYKLRLILTKSKQTGKRTSKPQ